MQDWAEEEVKLRQTWQSLSQSRAQLWSEYRSSECPSSLDFYNPTLVSHCMQGHDFRQSDSMAATDPGGLCSWVAGLSLKGDLGGTSLYLPQIRDGFWYTE